MKRGVSFCKTPVLLPAYQLQIIPQIIHRVPFTPPIPHFFNASENDSNLCAGLRMVNQFSVYSLKNDLQFRQYCGFGKLKGGFIH
jgi:hypothetical protein